MTRKATSPHLALPPPPRPASPYPLHPLLIRPIRRSTYPSRIVSPRHALLRPLGSRKRHHDLAVGVALAVVHRAPQARRLGGPAGRGVERGLFDGDDAPRDGDVRLDVPEAFARRVRGEEGDGGAADGRGAAARGDEVEGGNDGDFEGEVGAWGRGVLVYHTMGIYTLPDETQQR